MKDYITKEFWRAELSEFRMEMRVGSRDLRTEMRPHPENRMHQIDRMGLLV